MAHCGALIDFHDHLFPDIEIRVPSLTNAQTVLDYEPRFDLVKALDPTVQWYQEHLSFFEPWMAAPVATA